MKKWITVYTILISLNVFSIEICDNGIDDDGDGLIDLNDDECNCNVISNWEDITNYIPNPDFENYSQCPTTAGQLSRCSNWNQGFNSSDYYNCSFGVNDIFSEFSLPTSGSMSGTGYMGFASHNAALSPYYRERIVTCLSTPLLAGTKYRLKFLLGFGTNSNPVGLGTSATEPGGLGSNSLPNFNITIYGATNCINETSNQCPTSTSNGFIELVTKTISGVDAWVEGEIEFTPSIDIGAILIGPDCNASVYSGAAGKTEYYLLDRLILEKETLDNNNIEAIINKQGDYCKNNISITSNREDGETIQWYRDGIAIVNKTNTTLQIDTNEKGNYSCMITDINNDCSISNEIEIKSSLENCNQKSQENYTYIPNSFTPNGDNHNEKFTPVFSNEDKISDYTFQIFNKWGQLLFETNEPHEGWDGTFKNIKVKQGIYVWKYALKVNNDLSIENKIGHVALIK